ncbi:unnamed protein product [Adineta steineri]|uniref:ADP-ribosylhydrolase ARH3 n=1 Tax=Adineta steineri TaxID=433720 RepID=A0A814RGE4_9BILA|nr:unnamed protein product [Adineta steineri]CAF1201374.1 unnamed protein product [Adineta steineri]
MDNSIQYKLYNTKKTREADRDDETSNTFSSKRFHSDSYPVEFHNNEQFPNDLNTNSITELEDSQNISSSSESNHITNQILLNHPSCQFLPDKKWLNCQYYDLEKTKIKRPNEIENEMEDPPEINNKEILNRIQGSIIGMALGDALGAHVEFRPRSYLLEHPVNDLQGGGTWGLEIGQFTDDTSMGVCLANSLIARHDFIPYDQLVRYRWWHIHGYMSSTGKCFDIGSATKQSLEKFGQKQKIFAQENNIPLQEIDYLSDAELLKHFDVYCSVDEVAGNGALMRLAPVPLFFYEQPIEAIEYSGISGQITHGDIKAYDACRYYASLIVAALHGETKEKLLDKDFYLNHKQWFKEKDLHPDIMEISQGSFKKPGGYNDGIRGKGYIVNALEAALWAFWSDEGSFKKGACAAVNLGDDTDTTAAIYGQLAGAYYGYNNLPSEWIEKIYAKKFLQILSKWIAYEGQLWTSRNFPPSTTTSTITLPLDNKHTIIPSSPEKLQESSPSQKLQESSSSEKIQVSSSSKHIDENKSNYSKTFPVHYEKSPPNNFYREIPIIKENNSYHEVPVIKESTSISHGIRSKHDNVSFKREENNSYQEIPIGIGSRYDNRSPKREENNYFHEIPIDIGSRHDNRSFKREENFTNHNTFSSYSNKHDQSSYKSSSNRRNNMATWNDNDIYEWLQSLGGDYKVYADRFKKEKVDGFQLFMYFNRYTLIKLGITNENHQQKILDDIQRLKNLHMSAF